MMHLEGYRQGYIEKNKISLMGFFSLRFRLRYNQLISIKRKNYTFNAYSKWGAFTNSSTINQTDCWEDVKKNRHFILSQNGNL